MSGVGLVLTYHRIGSDAVDPWGLQVTPVHFREHLQVLRTLGTIVPLSQVGMDTSLPNFAITVDDGYAETLSLLHQELENADVPATIFVVSDYLGISQEYWWDSLERLLESGDGSEPGSQTTWRAWEEPVTAPQRAYQQAVATMRATAPPGQQSVLDHLLGATASGEARASRRVVTPYELRAIASCPLIEVGSHTRRHPVLSGLTAERQQHELAGAHEVLSGMIERPLASLAYPFGQRTDYNAESIAIAGRIGVGCACSNATGIVTSATPRLDLPRWQVHDCGADELAGHIRLLIG